MERWVLISILAFLSIPTALAECTQGTCSVIPTETDELLFNPGIGWVTYVTPAISNTHIPPGVTSKIHYMRLSWEELHLGEGVYNWAPIETQITMARQGGQQYFFRIMPTNPSNNENGPTWMRDAGYAGYTHKHNCVGDELWVPDLDNSQVQAEVSAFLEALGNRYDNHPDILALEFSLVGTWGEGHYAQACLPPYNNPNNIVPLPTDQTLMWLVDEHYDNFPNTPLIGPITCADNQVITKYMYETYGQTKGAGIFMDCWGDFSSGPGDWSHMNHSYPACFDYIHSSSEHDSWEKGMIRLEPCISMHNWPEGDIQRALDWALDNHASFFHNKNGDVPAEALDDVTETLKRLGYRLVLRNLSHQEYITNGQLSLTLDFENVGVAPPYKDFYLAVLLDGPESQTFVSGESIKYWLPGEIHSKTLSFSTNLDSGTYDLSVGIVSPYDQEPAIDLAIEGRDNGWYPMSVVEVLNDCGDNQCTGTENCSSCPEDCGECCVPMTFSELISIVNEWILDNIDLNEVIEAVAEWKNGC